MTKQPTIGNTMHNGYTVLAMVHDAKSGVVLAQSGNEYATWRYNVEQGERSTWSGCYFSNAESARENFQQRAIGEIAAMLHLTQ